MCAIVLNRSAKAVKIVYCNAETPLSGSIVTKIAKKKQRNEMVYIGLARSESTRFSTSFKFQQILEKTS
jgi:hypothetical protein